MENEVKQIAREAGAALVGISSKERLLDGPPSANPEYLLPSTKSIISLAVALDKKIIRDFMSKKDWLSHCEERKQLAQQLYGIGDLLCTYLRNNGFDAMSVDVNNNYRPEPTAKDVTEMTEFLPEFAHRYGAVASGIGRLGWSGNILTLDYGALVELGTVLTSAKLPPDPVLEVNPCDRCKLCTAVCPVQMINNRKTIKVTVAGIEEEIAAKRPNTCCWIGCTGYQGLASNGKWSNWSPYRLSHPLPEDKGELDALNIRLQKADPQMHLESNSFTDYRAAMFDPDWFTNTVCGNCRLVCWQKRQDREHNKRLIINSGIVTLNPNGEHIVAREEILEIDTPYIVKVAMLREEYQRNLIEKKSVDKKFSLAPIDRAVLSHIFE
ncbi:MAG: epoxyqueuosine reductase [Dehalococcoidia bacterium]|nr:MAG: epoxyqueuosine reductase [Dehalococcoidia bacterium]